MITIRGLDIKNGEATGFVYSDELTPLQLKKLNLSEVDTNGFCHDIPVHIEYSIQWDGDLPMITIEEVVLFNDMNGEDFSLFLRDTDYNYDALSLELEEKGPYPLWIEERNECGELKYYNGYYDDPYGDE